jgi:hypothetical protein
MRSIPFAAGRPVFVPLFGLLLLLPFAAGCGSGRGKVSGQVLYNGVPLPGGRVTFRPADPKENSVSAEVDEQGAYEAVLPLGEVKVSIDNRQLAPRGPGAGQLPADLPLSPDVRKNLNSGKPDQPAPKSEGNVAKKASGNYVKIPDRYHTVETSGLQFAVESRDQKHDIELTK